MNIENLMAHMDITDFLLLYFVSWHLFPAKRYPLVAQFIGGGNCLWGYISYMSGHENCLKQN
jgi:hypothetical protein